MEPKCDGRSRRRVRADTQLDRVIGARVAPDEWDAIQEAAAGNGMSAGLWLRSLALKELTKSA